MVTWNNSKKLFEHDRKLIPDRKKYLWGRKRPGTTELYKLDLSHVPWSNPQVFPFWKRWAEHAVDHYHLRVKAQKLSLNYWWKYSKKTNGQTLFVEDLKIFLKKFYFHTLALKNTSASNKWRRQTGSSLYSSVGGAARNITDGRRTQHPAQTSSFMEPQSGYSSSQSQSDVPRCLSAFLVLSMLFSSNISTYACRTMSPNLQMCCRGNTAVRLPASFPTK